MRVGDNGSVSAYASALVSLVLAACGPNVAACGPNVVDAPLKPPRPSLITSSAAPAPVTSALDAPAPCELKAPEAPAPPPSALSNAPAYVLVKHTGVLRIDNSGVVVAKPMGESMSPWNTSVVAGPDGELWTSDWTGVTVVPLGSVTARSIRTVKDGPLYEHLIVRSATDIWAVTSDIDWSVVHYDGKAWKAVRERRHFPGKFDDIKFTALQVTSSAVWVSTWNGIWRGVGKEWQKVEPPGNNEETIVDLFVYRDKLVAALRDGLFLREGTSWRKLGAPASLGHIWTVSDLGIVAGGGADNKQVLLSSIDDGGCVVTSAPLKGGVIHDIAIDQSGRVWVATDFRLSVLDRAGRVIAEWAPGTLEGLVGDSWRVAVAGAGPSNLPAPKAARSFDIIGRMVTYKSDSPLAGADLELCPDPDEERGCAGASFVKRATAQADGSFRFNDVPDGDFTIHVRPPPGMSDCDGIFRLKGKLVSPASDCKAVPAGGRVCDLGTLTQCLPFEMPPPR